MHTGWLEGDLNYSQVLAENSDSRLTGGVTLQIMKAISGAYLRINRLSFLESKNANDTSYTFTEGNERLDTLTIMILSRVYLITILETQNGGLGSVSV